LVIVKFPWWWKWIFNKKENHFYIVVKLHCFYKKFNFLNLKKILLEIIFDFEKVSNVVKDCFEEWTTSKIVKLKMLTFLWIPNYFGINSFLLCTVCKHLLYCRLKIFEIFLVFSKPIFKNGFDKCRIFWHSISENFIFIDYQFIMVNSFWQT